MINRLEHYYKNGVSVKNNKLVFYSSEISLISSNLYQELYYTHYDDTFNIYLDILQDKIQDNIEHWLYINFDNESITGSCHPL